MRKKYLLLFFLLLFGSILFYLWYAHASIYWKLGSVGLSAPNDLQTYVLGDAKSNPITYVAIGDSLTAGVGVETYTQSYPYLIAQMLASSSKKSVKLIPFAVPGVRTQYVIDTFLGPVAKTKPDVVTLLIGVNDIHGKVSDTVFREHYSEILNKLTQTNAHVYVIALPYIGTPSLIWQPFRAYFNWRTEQYNSIIKELALQYKVTYIDLYSTNLPQELNDTYYAADHFHPNALGYTLWARSLYAGFDQ